MKINNSAVPVVLFVYNRSHQLLKTLRGLKANNIPLLYVFADGPKSKEDADAVEEVRQIIDAIHWVKVEKIYHEVNKGLRRSVIEGLDFIFSRYNQAVIIEDDVYVTPGFYDYMVRCLVKYKDAPDIAGVTGLRYPFERTHLSDDKYDVFLSPRISSWGWGTWRRVWKNMNFDHRKLVKVCSDKKLNLAYGGIDMLEMVEQFCADYLTTSWAVIFYINMRIHNQYFIWPKRNMVVNTGVFGGTHPGSKDNVRWRLRWEMGQTERPVWSLPDKPTVNPDLLDDFLAFFGSQRSYEVSLQRKIKQAVRGFTARMKSFPRDVFG
ncbi:glycosyltransferase [Candidatus Saccharibacteria bacterium]|nr:glycosyltransferase [Candidatus Saccharibacteria bacterium]